MRGTKAYHVVGQDASSADSTRWHAIGETVLRHWQEMLRLDQWRISLGWNDDRGWDYFGCVQPSDGRPEARVTLWSYIPDAETLERSVIHELTHLVLMDFTRLGDQWREQVPEEMRVMYDSQWHEQLEQVVDHITMSVDGIAGGLITHLTLEALEKK